MAWFVLVFYAYLPCYLPSTYPDFFTEEYDIRCSVCGYIIEARLNHTHVFDKEVVDEQYKASGANCTAPAKYYKTCACGEKGTETFENGSAAGHNVGTEWKSDKDNHWNECACGEKANNAAHKDENMDGKCDVCEYNVGTATTNPDSKPSGEPQSPQTGDNSMLWMWIALLFAGGFGIVTVYLFGKKRFSAE